MLRSSQSVSYVQTHVLHDDPQKSATAVVCSDGIVCLNQVHVGGLWWPFLSSQPGWLSVLYQCGSGWRPCQNSLNVSGRSHTAADHQGDDAESVVSSEPSGMFSNVPRFHEAGGEHGACLLGCCVLFRWLLVTH